jgi:hypothetical protein
VELVFSVLDSTGRVKIKPAGTGVTLTDPVGVTHGGTALTAVSQGDLLMASASNTLARLSKSTTLTPPQVLSFESGDLTPSWRTVSELFTPGAAGGYIPNPASREYSAPHILSCNYLAGGWPASTTAFGRTVVLSGGVQTDATDSTSTWARGTTGAVSGNNTQFAFDASGFSAFFQYRWEGMFIGKIRTGSDITNIRLICGIGSSLTPSSDSPTGIVNQIVGIRYSTSASDAGWTAWVFDGNLPYTQTANITSILASTAYTIQIRIRAVSGSPDYAADFTVGSTTVTLSVPFTLLNATQLNNAVIGVGLTTLTNASRVVDANSFYNQTGHSSLIA